MSVGKNVGKRWVLATHGAFAWRHTALDLLLSWQPQRGSNPCLHLEREAGSPLRGAEHVFHGGETQFCGSLPPSAAQSRLAGCWQTGPLRVKIY